MNEYDLLEDVVCIKGNLIDLGVLRTDRQSILIYTNWMNDEEIKKWTGYNNRVINFDQVSKWINENRSIEDCIYSIFEKKSRRLVGTCSCRMKRGTKNATIDVCIGHLADRHKGYGIEATSRMVDFAFEDMNVHRVEVKINSENTAAIQCYKEVGFIECGRCHESDYFEGHYSDSIILEILKKDWLSRRLVSKPSKNKNKNNNNEEEPQIRDISLEEDEILINEPDDGTISYERSPIFSGYLIISDDDIIPPTLENQISTIITVDDFVKYYNSNDLIVDKGIFIKANVVTKDVYKILSEYDKSFVNYYAYNDLPDIDYIKDNIIVYRNDTTEILSTNEKDDIDANLLNVLVLCRDVKATKKIVTREFLYQHLTDLPINFNIEIRDMSTFDDKLKNICSVVYVNGDVVFKVDRLLLYNRKNKPQISKNIVDLKCVSDPFSIVKNVSNKHIYMTNMLNTMKNKGVDYIDDLPDDYKQSHKNLIMLFSNFDEFMANKNIDDSFKDTLQSSIKDLTRDANKINMDILI